MSKAAAAGRRRSGVDDHPLPVVEDDLVAAEEANANDKFSAKGDYLNRHGFQIIQPCDALEQLRLNLGVVGKDEPANVVGLQSLRPGLWNYNFPVKPGVQQGIFLKYPVG